MNWLLNVLIAIDQLGNTLAGGNPDLTISARVGFFANKDESPRFLQFWKILEFIINLTFYPIDGKNHCYQAYLNDTNEKHVHGNDLARAFLSLIIVPSCLLISLVTWGGYILRFWKPKNSRVT